MAPGKIFAQDTTERYLAPFKDTLKMPLHDTSLSTRSRRLGEYYLNFANFRPWFFDSAAVYLNKSAHYANLTQYRFYQARAELALGKLLINTRKYEAGIKLFNASIAVLDSIKAESEIQQAYYWVYSHCLHNHKTYNFIIRACDYLIPYYQQRNMRLMEIYARGLKAQIHFKQGLLDDSEKEIEYVIDELKKIDSNYISRFFSSLSWITRYKGNYAKALHYAMEAVDHAKLPRDSASLQKYYIDLADLYHNLGPSEKYREYRLKSMQMFPNTGALMNTHHRLYYLRDLGADTDSIIRVFTDTLNKYGAKTENEIYNVNMFYADNYQVAKKYGLSETYWLQLTEIEKKLNRPDNPNSMYLNYNLATFYMEWKKYEKAEPYLKTILAFPKGQFPLGIKREAYLMYYQVDSAAGRYLSAINHLLEYRKLYDLIKNESTTWQIHELNTKYELSKKEQRLKQLTDSSVIREARFRILNDSLVADNRIRQIEELKRNFESAGKNKSLKLLHAENLLAQARVIALSDSITTSQKLRALADARDSVSVAQTEQSIRLLISETELQQRKLKDATLSKKLVIGGISLMAFVIMILGYLYLLREKTNRQIHLKNLTLQKLVEEKEWLLKEVHHRVKNNLHTVVSLLESQSAFLTDDALAAVISSQNRVYTMSLIHQKLYKSGDITTIDMAVYLPELIRYLAESYDVDKKIRFSYEIARVDLNGSCAVPVGLIVNEAVTNSIKHAFRNVANPGLLIALSKENDGRIKLRIADNGIGISDQDIVDNSSSLGIKLMRGLTLDIGGSLHITNNHGTTIVLEIPAEQVGSDSMPDLKVTSNIQADGKINVMQSI